MHLFKTITAGRPLVLVGCGRMGTALSRGWLAGGLAAEALVVVEPAGRPTFVSAVRHVRDLADLPDGFRPRVMVLAVKPQRMGAVLDGLSRFSDASPLLLSIAAGITLQRLMTASPSAVRAMPNTPALVGKGITGAIAAPAVGAEDMALAQGLLDATGETLWLEDEAHLDVVTAVSGSGPAYVYALAETLAGAGVSEGLSNDIAARLARQTVIGAAAMLEQSGMAPDALREQVTSPGGTTEAALGTLLSEDGLGDLMRKAVAAAVARSRELAD